MANKKGRQKNGPMFPSPRRIAGPVVLGRYGGCPDALSKQASPVSVLTRSARSKHITSLCRLGEGGGRTLTSGQLQSSPAPFSQPGGEFLCQHTHTHTKRTPNPTEPYVQGRVGTGRDANTGCSWSLADSVYIGVSWWK